METLVNMRALTCVRSFVPLAQICATKRTELIPMLKQWTSEP